MGLAPDSILKDRYRITRWLAQGGFGAVYLAADMRHDERPVAIKESLESSPRAEAQFTREARLLASIDHPGLPRVIDYFSIPDQGQYLVMDYIEGDDLAAILAQAGGRLSETRVLPWILQVCEAVRYLHAQRPPIIHRDIKPANIKITPDGRAVLVDFGIAKLYEESQATATTARAISPGYSPIEQYGGRGTNERSDIYALGASLYHVLTGQIPPESVYRRPTQPLASPHDQNPTVSARVAHAVLRATAYSAEERFDTIEAFADALQRSSEDIRTVMERAPAAVPPTRPEVLPATATVRAGRALRTSQLLRRPATWVWSGGVISFAIAAWWLAARLFIPGAVGTPSAPLANALVAPASATRPAPAPTATATITAAPTATDPPTPTHTPEPTVTATPYGGAGGQWIAFVSVRTGSRQLYLVRTDGSSLTRVTNSAGNDNSPTWSPDGTRLAFASDRGGNWDIYSMLADGSGMVNLTAHAADEQTPAWSPDGQYIAFQSNRAGDNDLYIMRADGSEPRLLVGGVGDEGFPAWSPDGQWLAYQSNRDRYYTLYAVRVDGTQDTQLVRPNIGGLAPAWSPDGAQIGFLSFRDGPSKLYRVNFAEALLGSPVIERLSTNSLDDQSPMFSPDGQRVVFTSKRTGDYEIYVLTLADMTVQRLTTSSGHDQYPAWQP